MKNKVLSFIEKNQLFSPGDKVIVGFSGGADSTALLILLTELEEILQIHITALHVHHGIRGTSADEDEAFCREFCRVRRIDYISRYVETLPFSKEQHLSLEEAARILRYRVFEEVMEKTGANKTALAHHKDDQAETVLFHMIRGSALKGLSGMQKRRDTYVRPLLCVKRKEIQEYLVSKGVSWREDETNHEDASSRNRLRLYVLPELEKIRTDSTEKIAETAEYLSEVNHFLEKEAMRRVREHITSVDTNKTEVDKEAFSDLDPVLQDYVLYDMIRKAGASLKDITRQHLHDAKELVKKPVGKGVDLPRGIRFVSTYTGIMCEIPLKDGVRHSETDKELPKMIIEEKSFKKGQEIPDLSYTKWFDCAKINAPVTLRNFEEGDRIAIRPGKHKKLNRFFIDEKIPSELRKKIPVVAMGNDILWVVGYRMSEDFKITDNTKTILEIRICL